MLSPRILSLLAIALLIWLLWKLFGGSESSFFRLREADRLKNTMGRNRMRRGNEKNIQDDLAQAKFTVRKTPLLGGFATDLPPHETLGIAETANQSEIQNAFKIKMKQYHPDKIGPQGSQQWKDAQAIAIALGAARDAMLAKVKKHK